MRTTNTHLRFEKSPIIYFTKNSRVCILNQLIRIYNIVHFTTKTDFYKRCSQFCLSFNFGRCVHAGRRILRAIPT